MLHNTTIETSLGTVDFTIFYFSPWMKGYFVILWTFVVLSNACSLVYIYRKLNLSNVVNLIPLLDCVINLISFFIIGISSLNLWCKAAVLISKTLLLSGKFFEIIKTQVDIKPVLFLGHFTSCFLSITRYVIVVNGVDSHWIGTLRILLLPLQMFVITYSIVFDLVHEAYIGPTDRSFEVSITYTEIIDQMFSIFAFYISDVLIWRNF